MYRLSLSTPTWRVHTYQLSANTESQRHHKTSLFCAGSTQNIFGEHQGGQYIQTLFTVLLVRYHSFLGINKPCKNNKASSPKNLLIDHIMLTYLMRATETLVYNHNAVMNIPKQLTGGRIRGSFQNCWNVTRYIYCRLCVTLATQMALRACDCSCWVMWETESATTMDRLWNVCSTALGDSDMTQHQYVCKVLTASI